MEPLFDHLYGLGVPRGGQWHLYTTRQRAADLGFPRPMSRSTAARRSSSPAPSHDSRACTVWRLYFRHVAMSVVAEIIYISVMDVHLSGRSPVKVPRLSALPRFHQCHVGRDQWNHRLAPGPAVARSVAALPASPRTELLRLRAVPAAASSTCRSARRPTIRRCGPCTGALTVAGAIAWTIAMLGKHLVVDNLHAIRPCDRSHQRPTGSRPPPADTCPATTSQLSQQMRWLIHIRKLVDNAGCWT